MYINLPEKRYYKIGEIANAFEVNTSLIRFWENEFDILKPKKNKKGNRLFTEEDLKNLKLIYFLVKEKGFTLDGAKNKLKENPEKIKSNHKIILRLEEIKNELSLIKDQL
jgi:DNA-binding transcriptional MerR regulator